MPYIVKRVKQRSVSKFGSEFTCHGNISKGWLLFTLQSLKQIRTKLEKWQNNRTYTLEAYDSAVRFPYMVCELEQDHFDFVEL